MQSVSDQNVNEIQIGDVTVGQIDDKLTWGLGSIQPQAGLDDGDNQQALLAAVVQSLTPVSDDEIACSSCTDGRKPVALLSGQPVPVREQNVGTDTMLFFHMAEVLGPRFYKDPNASLEQRLRDVVMFMRDNGLVPCTHIGCGAAAGYVPINQNLVNFTANPAFADRQKTLLPEGVYDEAMRQEITQGYQDRLSADAYAVWSDQLVVDVIKHVSGERAIAQLQDDGRGVHGHVEEQIIRLQIEGVAIDGAKLFEQTNGREVFGVNDMRLRRSAKLISRGDDQAYKMALMAAEDFTDGGHGTLAKNLPTYIFRLAQ